MGRGGKVTGQWTIPPPRPRWGGGGLIIDRCIKQSVFPAGSIKHPGLSGFSGMGMVEWVYLIHCCLLAFGLLSCNDFAMIFQWCSQIHVQACMCSIHWVCGDGDFL